MTPADTEGQARAIALWQQLGRDQMLRQGDPVATLRAALDAASAEGAAEALLAQAHGAAPQLRDRLPLVLWFEDPADRAEFVAAVEEAKPGMISRSFTP